eukprot:6207314-Pleurochrysis_carterae.AAC.3
MTHEVESTRARRESANAIGRLTSKSSSIVALTSGNFMLPVHDCKHVPAHGCTVTPRKRGAQAQIEHKQRRGCDEDATGSVVVTNDERGDSVEPATHSPSLSRNSASHLSFTSSSYIRNVRPFRFVSDASPVTCDTRISRRSK